MIITSSDISPGDIVIFDDTDLHSHQSYKVMFVLTVRTRIDSSRGKPESFIDVTHLMVKTCADGCGCRMIASPQVKTSAWLRGLALVNTTSLRDPAHRVQVLLARRSSR